MGKVNVVVEREFLSKVLFYLSPEDTPNSVIFKLQDLCGGVDVVVTEGGQAGCTQTALDKLGSAETGGEPPTPCPACGFPMEWAIASVYDVSREVYYCLHCPAAPRYCKFCPGSIELTDENVWRHISPYESHLCPKYGYPTEPAESREPEKCLSKRRDLSTTPDAAESSLSSPPPSPTIPCVWCAGRGYVYVTGKRCEGCVGTGRLKDYAAKAGAQTEASAATDSENTKQDSGAASPELLPTQLPKEK